MRKTPCRSAALAVIAAPLLHCERPSAQTALPQSPPAPTITASAAPAPVVSTSDVPPASADGGSSPSGGPVQLAFKAAALPDVSPPAFLDYIAWEPARARVWVPVANTGSVDVFSSADGTFSRVDGFKTAEREVRGNKRQIGPNAVSIGDGFAYIGNRATGEVCPVQTNTLKAAKCLKLPSPSDGVAYVASVKEVWVTMPRDRALAVLDATVADSLRMKSTVKLDGAPEGYAADDVRALFFTNLEDKNKTVAVDLKTHQPRASWDVDCGSAGPRGIAAEAAHGFLFVACTDRVLMLDGARGGERMGALDVGDGIDNIDWFESRRLLYVAAARAAKLVIARVDDHGQFTIVAAGATPEGARNAVADATGTAYVTDPAGARLLVFPYGP
jgi:hypothetical protein